MKLEVKVILENGEIKELKGITKPETMLVLLEDDYALTGNYKLYKRKGNVICGEKVEYRSLDIYIKN